MLRVLATSSQSIGLNSAFFSVTSGANYTAIFAARVTPTSVGSGYLLIVFLGSSESTRETIPLEAPLILLGTVATDSHGAFDFKLNGLQPHVLLLANYAGNDGYWPSYAQANT